MNAGERIKQALESASISQRTLAEETGISQATLSRILSGHRSAKLPEIIKIAWFLGVPVARLAGVIPASELQFAARADEGAVGDQMRAALTNMALLNRHLAHAGVPASQ